jgi:hypothetical protein
MAMNFAKLPELLRRKARSLTSISMRSRNVGLRRSCSPETRPRIAANIAKLPELLRKA